MPVSRRLRFEVLRRDGYTCRYCGARAPDATLTVDHVVPVTLGGDDDARNLVTACVDCNAGKSSIAPDAAIVEDVDATTMLFARAVEAAAELRRADQQQVRAAVNAFDDEWLSYGTGGYTPRQMPRDEQWHHTIERFYDLGLNGDDLVHFVEVAMRSRAKPDDVWRYFCGCCWRELSSRQELARRLIEDGDV